MIKADEIFKIGKLIKPHGVKGEIIFDYENDIFDKCDCPYLICLIDGIFVPFFIKGYRFKNADVALVSFEDIVTEEQAKKLTPCEVYFPRKYYDTGLHQDSDNSLNFFIGLEVIDQEKGILGNIIDVDTSTMNILFLVKDNNDNDLIIPASDDFIREIDSDNKKIYMNLPEGLFD